MCVFIVFVVVWCVLCIGGCLIDWCYDGIGYGVWVYVGVYGFGFEFYMQGCVFLACLQWVVV